MSVVSARQLCHASPVLDLLKKHEDEFFADVADVDLWHSRGKRGPDAVAQGVPRALFATKNNFPVRLGHAPEDTLSVLLAKVTKISGFPVGEEIVVLMRSEDQYAAVNIPSAFSNFLCSTIQPFLCLFFFFLFPPLNIFLFSFPRTWTTSKHAPEMANMSFGNTQIIRFVDLSVAGGCERGERGGNGDRGQSATALHPCF